MATALGVSSSGLDLAGIETLRSWRGRRVARRRVPEKRSRETTHPFRCPTSAIVESYKGARFRSEILRFVCPCSTASGSFVVFSGSLCSIFGGIELSVNELRMFESTSRRLRGWSLNRERSFSVLANRKLPKDFFSVLFGTVCEMLKYCRNCSFFSRGF
jgi:hypothetical protein